jgi:hypothetical protein
MCGWSSSTLDAAAAAHLHPWRPTVGTVLNDGSETAETGAFLQNRSFTANG